MIVMIEEAKIRKLHTYDIAIEGAASIYVSSNWLIAF
jgi:hypothetical protein